MASKVDVVSRVQPDQSGKLVPALRPRSAATLIVYRRHGNDVQYLMGRRALSLAFMPGALVFPGGRLDRADHRAPSLDELDPAIAAKLLQFTPHTSAGQARALALACIRETYEETGYLIGANGNAVLTSRSPAWSGFLNTGIVPVLSQLRLVARAITPPGRTRRFDARFFAVNAEAIAQQVPVPHDELDEPVWVTAEQARGPSLSNITGVVINQIEKRLADGGDLRPDGPVIFARNRRNKRQPVLEY